jgi:hypothetical protein
VLRYGLARLLIAQVVVRLALMASMELKVESQEGFLLATASGNVSLTEAVEGFKAVCDTAAEQGFGRILIDCSASEGELSVLERYELGKTLADYCLSRSMTPKIAAIGKPPTINGVAAQVAWNRGLTAQTFSELRPALNWLNAFS